MIDAAEAEAVLGGGGSGELLGEVVVEGLTLEQVLAGSRGLRARDGLHALGQMLAETGEQRVGVVDEALLLHDRVHGTPDSRLDPKKGSRVCHAARVGGDVGPMRQDQVQTSDETSGDAMTVVSALIGLVAGLVIGALVVWILAGSRMQRVSERAVQAEALLAAARAETETARAETQVARAETVAARAQVTAGASMADLITPVRESLENLRRASDASSRDRASAEATLTSQITAVQERYQSLEGATKQLVSALSRGQTRGQWGEMQLEGLLQHAGVVEGVHFTRQGTRRDGESAVRPDIVIMMPGGGEVLIDAKFPFDAYWQASTAEEQVTRDEFMRKHAADVLLRARELSSKGYSDGAKSPDFVVMFLPLESLLSSALDADGLLLERTFERKVVLATPTTMLALLRTIAFGYQRQLMADNAEQIRQAGAEMLTRLANLSEHLEGMRRGLDQAVKGYNSFVGSFDRQAMRQARRMHEMGVEAPKGVESPAAIETDLRTSDPAALRSD